jgi:NADP-dependent 3-hydroxy acid dehydrogenase YdfG
MAPERLRALVTGATAGIGEAVVRALVAEGMEVWALGRRADRLERLQGETGCQVISADVRDRAALAEALESVEIDILVNNAGLGFAIGGMLDADPEDIATTIETNVTALLQLSRHLLPGMVARRSGHIVNLGSVAGLYPCGSAVYGGSKGAVRLISQNLRLELRGTGVRVTEICPGRVTTEFYDVAMPDAEAATRAKDTGIRELEPRDIATAVVYAVTAPAHVNVSTIELQPLEQTYGGVNFDPL